MFELRRRE